MLEENVDDKYYLSDKAIGRLVRYSNRIIRKQENPNISSCLMANYFAMGGRNQQYIKDDNATRICGIYDEQNKRHQAGSIKWCFPNNNNINRRTRSTTYTCE